MKLIAFLSLFIWVQANQVENEKLLIEIELSDLDLMDNCERIGEIHKDFLLGNTTLETEVSSQISLGKLVRNQAEIFKKITNIPDELQEKVSLFVKPGDNLLEENDLRQLIEFGNKYKYTCHSNKTNRYDCNLNLEQSKMLKPHKNASENLILWSKGQRRFDLDQQEYYTLLSLAEKAARLNDEPNVRSYWEMLTDFPDGYKKAEELWEEIRPFYQKFHEFIKKRLEKVYKTSLETSYIPVYLLDSQLPEEILPHPQIYQEVLSKIQEKPTQELYQLGESMGVEMGFEKFKRKFWEQSNFSHQTCIDQLIAFCNQEFDEIITCNETSWPKFLKTQQIVMDLLIRNQNVRSSSKNNRRFSVLDEAVKILGISLALNELPHNGILTRNIFSSKDDPDFEQLTLKLLIAIEILPKIPYYLNADLWRLEEIEFASRNLSGNWWAKRNKIEGISSIDNDEPNFLQDEFLVSNTPYLSKFLGIFLQFQILDYYQKYVPNDENRLIKSITDDPVLLEVIKERNDKNWQTLINYQFAIDEIQSMPLLEYFASLEDYFQNFQDFDSEPKNLLKSTTTDKIPIEICSNSTLETIEISENRRIIEKTKRAGFYVIAACLSFVFVVSLLLISRNRCRKRRLNRNRNRS